MSRTILAGRPDDEILLAFADGTLAAEDAERVARYLETDADACGLVGRLRRSGAIAAGAFDDVLNEPVPGQLIATVLGAPANVVGLARPRRSHLPAASWSRALAASLLLSIGAASGYFAGMSSHPVAGRAVTGLDMLAAGSRLDLLAAGSRLAEVLETQPSHRPSTIPVAGGGMVEAVVVATYRDGAGRYCREIELTPEDTPGADVALTMALACRPADGGWRLEGAFRVASASGAVAGEYNPAGSSASSPLDSLLRMHGAVGAMSPADEATLIRGGWRRQDP